MNKKRQTANSLIRPKINILGVNFELIKLSEVVEKIRLMIEMGGGYQIGTFNPEYLVRGQEDKQLKRVIAKIGLIVPDGIAILWAAKFLKFKEKLKKRLHFDYDDRVCQFPKLIRIRGGDLVEKLASLSAEKGYKIALIGGEEGIAWKALTALQKKYPSLAGFADRGPRCLNKLSPSERRQSLKQVVSRIKQENPQILLTALSFHGPVWIDNLLEEIKKEKISLVALEVGGVFNYLAGKAKLPAKIVQQIGLEWLWRLIWEPWRFKRQLNLIKFLYLIGTQKLYKKE